MDWMVPKLSLSAEAQLEHNLRTMREKGPSDIEGTIRIACSLIQQNAIQQAIIRQAVGHIAQLELEQLLGSPKPRLGFLRKIAQRFRGKHV